MKQAEFEAIVATTISSVQFLLKIKGGEYTDYTDRLSNFKRGATLTGCTPLQVLFIYLSKHYDGVASYVKTSATGSPRESSEPIEGRFDDIINYCILAKALIAEEKGEVTASKVTVPTNEPCRDGFEQCARIYDGLRNTGIGVPYLPPTN